MIGPELFQARASEAIAGDAWVVDGNYGGQGVRDLVWARADTIVWLDYSLGVIFARLWRRTTQRIRSGEEIWPNTGNRETMRNAFFSTDSLFWWAVKTYGKRRRNYPRLLALPEYRDRSVLRFRRPAEAERWLAAQRAPALPRIHT
jgi:hypothetical protein